MSKGIKHSLSLTEACGGSAVKFLVQEVAGLLTVCNINAKFNSIFYNCELSFAAAVNPAGSLSKTFLVSYTGIAAFINTVRFADLFECARDKLFDRTATWPETAKVLKLA